MNTDDLDKRSEDSTLEPKDAEDTDTDDDDCSEIVYEKPANISLMQSQYVRWNKAFCIILSILFVIAVLQKSDLLVLVWIWLGAGAIGLLSTVFNVTEKAYANYVPVKDPKNSNKFRFAASMIFWFVVPILAGLIYLYAISFGLNPNTKMPGTVRFRYGKR